MGEGCTIYGEVMGRGLYSSMRKEEGCIVTEGERIV